MRQVCLLAGLLCLAAAPALAQDPVKVDPKHYKVEMENGQVRVLRIHYGPHEKSVMHEHPGGVAVFSTDHKAKFTLADGTTVERQWKAGQARWLPGEKHLPENVGDKPLELVLIELKAKAPSKPAAAKPAEGKAPSKGAAKKPGT